MSRIAQSTGLILITALLLCSNAAKAITAEITTYQRERGPYGRSLVLDLNGSPLRLLLNPSTVTSDTTVLTGLGQTTSYENDSFTGIVEGEKNSWVRLTITKTKLTGVYSTQGQRFEVATDQYGVISVKPLADNHPIGNPISASRSRSPLADTQTKVTRIAKIGIIVDSQYNEIFDGNGLEKALSIINAVDGIYREEFGLGIQVAKVINIIDRQSDPFNFGPVLIEQMLRNLRDYRMNSQDLTDISLVHLFSGNPNTDEPVGLAWIDTACRTDGFDVGISTPYRHDILLAAHEIAHNLGAQHDSDTACSVEHDKIMWPYISSNTSQFFSSCTLESVAASLEASCHAETIDVQVSLEQSVIAADTITAIVRNNDQLRTSPSAMLSIDLPDNTTATPLQGDCDSPDRDIHCDVGTLLPGAEETIIVQFDQTENFSEKIHFLLENQDSADPYPENNLASLKIDNGAITPVTATYLAAVNPEGGNSGTQIHTGIGAILLPGMLMGLLLKLTTGNRRKLRVNR